MKTIRALLLRAAFVSLLLVRPLHAEIKPGTYQLARDVTLELLEGTRIAGSMDMPAGRQITLIRVDGDRALIQFGKSITGYISLKPEAGLFVDPQAEKATADSLADAAKATTAAQAQKKLADAQAHLLNVARSRGLNSKEDIMAFHRRNFPLTAFRWDNLGDIEDMIEFFIEGIPSLENLSRVLSGDAPATMPGPSSAAPANVPTPATPSATTPKAPSNEKLAAYLPQFAAATGIKLVPIPAGTFIMGSPPHEADRNKSEGPQTTVTLTKDYFLGATEVTQGQYEALTGKNPSFFHDTANPSSYRNVGKDAPVECVSWEDAMGFCQKLTERERAAGRLPDGYVFTLPTEAQWEYACRAGTTGPFTGDIDAVAWYKKNSDSKTHTVGTKKPNAWGLCDMLGNVMEWCLDQYGSYPGGRVTDWSIPASGADRAFRGGSWNYSAAFCRFAFRQDFGYQLYYRGNDFGFRIALAPSPTK